MDVTIFDHFPEPVFYICAQKIAYSNAAALALAPGWTAGGAVPEALRPEPDGEGVFSCTLAGQAFLASATRDGEEGVLLVLRRPAQPHRDPALEHLPSLLREQISDLQVSADRLGALLRDSGDESGRRYQAVLVRSCYRLLRLVQHLEQAEPDGGPETALTEVQPVDLALLCRETAYGVAKLAEKAHVRFRGDIPGGIVVSMGDRALLEVMLLELISNALKAAGQGGQAGIRVQTNGSRVQIIVWDAGPGLSQAGLTALLDGSSPESLPKPGTGLRLGLSIARRAAAAHGGAILLESREGQGLRATVSLPIKKPSKVVARSPRLKAEESASPLLTILSDALPWQAFLIQGLDKDP